MKTLSLARPALRRYGPAGTFIVLAAVLTGMPAAPAPADHPARPIATAVDAASGQVPGSLGQPAPGDPRRTDALAALQQGLTGDDGEITSSRLPALPHGRQPIQLAPFSPAPGAVPPGGPSSGEPAGTASSSSSADSPPAAWVPAAPLPAPATGSQRVDIVLSPHPDDETLSLGVWIADAAARGDRVIVVCLTDGRSTGAVTAISRRLGRRVGRDQIAAARIQEFRAAATRLGVRVDDLYLAHLDADASPGGTRLTQPEAAAVIGAFAERFPAATFATMSWTAEQHPDHLNAGFALQEAMAEGVVRHAVFAVSRLYWSQPSPAAHEVLPASGTVRRDVRAAADAYDVWDPADQRLAVGWTSVHQQFLSLLADTRGRVHDWAPLAARGSDPMAEPASGETG